MTKATKNRTVSLSMEAREMIKTLKRLGVLFNVSEACSQAIVLRGRRAIFRTERTRALYIQAAKELDADELWKAGMKQIEGGDKQ